jgi:hypothetical protein
MQFSDRARQFGEYPDNLCGAPFGVALRIVFLRWQIGQRAVELEDKVAELQAKSQTSSEPIAAGPVWGGPPPRWRSGY